MENDREIDQVLMNIKQNGGGIASIMLYSAQIQMQLLVFLARMVSKALVSSGALGEYKTFLAKTEGKFDIYNIPISAESREKIHQLQDLETKLEKIKAEPGGSKKEIREIQKEIEALKKDIPEVGQLGKLGITHYVMPKLNGGENNLQVAVAKEDTQSFKAWFMNHINDHLAGGSKDIGELKSFTEGNYAIFNMPFEGEELPDILHDFDLLGINYTVLPDLKAGDGYTQLAVANKDQATVESWFSMWKEKQLQEGREVKGYHKMSEEDYMKTSAMDTEDYVANSDNKFQEANAEFEKEGTKVEKPDVVLEESSREFLELSKNQDFEKITINKEKLVDNFKEPPNAELMRNTGQGFFLSRVPGTWGESQETIILPNNRVFLADDGKTYVAFLPKTELTLVYQADGKIAKRDFAQIHAPYDKVTRGFDKVDGLIKTAAREETKKTAEKAAESSLEKAVKEAIGKIPPKL